MSKIELTSIQSLTNEQSALAAINANSSAIETASDTFLSRDGTSPNTMDVTLDMNSNPIINLAAPVSTSSAVRLIDVMSNPTIQVPPVGTSGATVPLLNANNTWSGVNTFSTAPVIPSFLSLAGDQTVTGNNTVSGATTFTGPVTFNSTLVTPPAVGFRAHKNSVNQTGIPSLTYTVITFGTEAFDRGGYWNASTSTWTPPAGMVVLQSQTWMVSGLTAGSSNIPVLKIFKNGSDVTAGIGWVSADFPGTGSVSVMAVDLATGSDSYQFKLNATTGGSITVDGNPAHTWAQGYWVGL